MRKAFFTICVLLLPVHAAFAGQGWYVTFVNFTDKPVTVKPSGETCWYWRQLESSFELPPGQTVIKYTEEKNSGACHSKKSLAGVDIALDGPPYNTHVEFKGKRGDFGVTIKTSIDCKNGYLGIESSRVVGNCSSGIAATLSINPAPK